MLPRERVIQVINHQQPDRIPYYGWVLANLSQQITDEWGSVTEFEDKYEFDFAHLFGGPQAFLGADLQALAAANGGTVEPAEALELPFTDPNDSSAYENLKAAVQHHKSERGRFVYVQTPGIFEALNAVFGIENHLLYMAMYPEELKQVYEKQANWNKQFALNCLDLGIDMIHVSDDWGSQESLMFSPKSWWEMIFPYHQITTTAVKQAGGFLSLHSDGNVNAVVDGIIELGYNVVHPWQESAGMSLTRFRDEYRGKFVVMGGLDVQTTIGFGRLDELVAEINRVLEMFAEGGLLYCTTHFIQDHCSIEELRLAYDTIYAKVRDLAG